MILCFNKKKKEGSLSKRLLEIKDELIRKQKHPTTLNLSKPEMELIEKIKLKTAEHNQNNITRTKAYYEFYRMHPEIHWAYLAHMVSRNGGWNMTDLKGDLIQHLLDKQTREDFFSLIERGNWLIFQDAYPQLLLYEESLNRKQNLFYLLASLGVSFFMETIWNDFWRHGEEYILTISLVINEQNYIEKRVLNNTYYQENVLNTLQFKLHELLAFNQILFPYYKGNHTRLIGQTINQFDHLHDRIMLGKRLYHLLFSDSRVLKGSVNWAFTHPHTGSRKDYWPHIFNDIKEYAPGTLSVRRLRNCQLKKGVARFYSPKLEFAWKDKLHSPAEEEDWYKDWDVINYLTKDIENVDGEIKSEYCETLEKLELAGIAKKAILL
jgi:hypothetical protein